MLTLEYGGLISLAPAEEEAKLPCLVDAAETGEPGPVFAKSGERKATRGFTGARATILRSVILAGAVPLFGGDKDIERE
jgi:hypothetical protein